MSNITVPIFEAGGEDENAVPVAAARAAYTARLTQTETTLNGHRASENGHSVLPSRDRKSVV